jgi:hypothetical protein
MPPHVAARDERKNRPSLTTGDEVFADSCDVVRAVVARLAKNTLDPVEGGREAVPMEGIGDEGHRPMMSDRLAMLKRQ